MTLIADARPDDVPCMARILGDWVAATPWMPKLHTAEEDRQFIVHLMATGSVQVARRDDAVLGFLARRGAAISALYVDAPVRRAGIGRILLNACKTEPALWLWTFQANSGAIRFYQSQGFVEIERTAGEDNEEKLPDVLLEWKRTAT